MFGYITPNASALSDQQKASYQKAYCGLCHAISVRHGQTARLTLSNDMTFVALLLNALYEPEEKTLNSRCPTRPIKKKEYYSSEIFDYAADMNVLLAYYKCLDDWQDEHKLVAKSKAKRLQNAALRIEQAYPDKSAHIRNWIIETNKIENDHASGIDTLINLTGEMLGNLFVYHKNDCWSEHLYRLGNALGRFIHFMDAYDDLDSDVKHNNFNPLIQLKKENVDYEELCKNAMTQMLAQAAEAFEFLPIVRDADLLRNILYSGVWTKYEQLQTKKEH